MFLNEESYPEIGDREMLNRYSGLEETRIQDDEEHFLSQ